MDPDKPVEEVKNEEKEFYNVYAKMPTLIKIFCVDGTTIELKWNSTDKGYDAKFMAFSKTRWDEITLPTMALTFSCEDGVLCVDPIGGRTEGPISLDSAKEMFKAGIQSIESQDYVESVISHFLSDEIVVSKK